MKTIQLILKVTGLTVLYFFLFLAISGLMAAGAEPPPDDQLRLIFLGLFLISFVNVVITTFIIRSSRWYGWRLAGATAFALYGAATFLSAIEAVYYAPALGSSYQEVGGILPTILLPNLIVFAIFMPIAVRVLGKWRADEGEMVTERPFFSPQQWIIKGTAVAILYYLLYLTFGFFVAWRNPELQAMYSAGADNALLMVWGVIPLQLFRGLLWVLFTLPVIRLARVQPWQLALLIGLLCSLPMSVPLFMPNELMPDASVRLSHFYEITASNFLLGMTLAWFFHRSHRSIRDFFNLDQAHITHESHSVKVATK